MAFVPPPPAGFVLDGSDPLPASAVPPPPPGFVMDVPAGTVPHDGDTFGIGGRNARLYGADAFELGQPGFQAGGTVDLGGQARGALLSDLAGGGRATATGAQTYGRPVVSLQTDQGDAGRRLIGSGLAIPTPQYLARDPARLTDYVGIQRDAIASERGAYGGQYQSPSDYRHQGAAAPMRGKIPMTPAQASQYATLVRDPRTTEAQLADWIKSQGHSATNVGNILGFVRRNPGAKLSSYFQQADALDQPVLPNGPGIVARSLGALNEGVADTLGAPADLVNGGLGLLGLPVSQSPFLGSENIRSALHAIGAGQDSEGYAPRSTAESYLQSAARGVGQVALPALGVLGGGAALAGRSLAAGMQGGPTRQALRSMLMETAARPGAYLAGEAAGGIGAGVGGQAARDAFPGNPWVDLAGQVLGGGLGSIGAGSMASRVRRPILSARAPAEPYGGGGPLPAGANPPEVPGASRILPDGRPQVDAVGDGQVAPGGGTPSDYRAGADPVDTPKAAAVPSAPSSVRGPSHPGLAGDYQAAVARLSADQTGEVPGALSHPEVGPIDLVWGDKSGGLAHIIADHPEVVDHLPMLIKGMDVESRSPNRVVLQGDNHRAIARLDYDGERKTWLLTAYERARKAPASAEYRRAGAGGRDGSPDLGANSNIGPSAGMDNGMRPTSVSDIPPPPPGFVLDSEMPAGPARGPEMMAPDHLASLARSIDPRDVQSLPANRIGSLDEAMRANPGTFRDVTAPNERHALPSYRLRPGGPVRKDPLDLIGWLRTKGGIVDQGGELSHMGIGNEPRQIDFARSEGFLGKLVKREDDTLPGLIDNRPMSLDEAAHNAWEVGFFPDHAERPTIAEFLDAVRETHAGGPGRVFHPDDYGAIDAFNAARAQRGAVETAAQEGAPLAEDVGQPIGPDDLEANQPPATAYEDLPSVGGRVGNIDVSKLETADDITRALSTVDQRFGGFDAARRGRVTQAETSALAGELGMTPEALLRRRRGQALNAEQALAARQLLAKSGEDLLGLAGKAVGGSDEDLATFQRALLRHAAIQEQVSGMTAEAGRTLAQFRMTADANAVPAHFFRDVISAAGGRKSVEDVAEHLVEMQRVTGDPSKVNTFAAKVAKPGVKDKLIEWWYNSLLSGPQTHVVNVVGNAVTSILQVPEHAAASAIGKARSLVTGSGDRVLASEVGARAFGLMKGAREGLQAFRYTLRTGRVPDQVSKVESALQEAIPGKLGHVVRTPTRLLSAEDELFKAVARRMELNSLAVREASKEGLTGKVLRDRIAALSSAPTDEMMADAADYARYVTFQRPLGPGLQALSTATNRSIPFKMVLPFLRTPTNIFSFALERSPMAPFVRGWRADVAAGGARRDLAIARAAMGSGLGLMISQWALSGDITGSRPRDRGVAGMKAADGWQPYSIRVGDKYYSYQRLDPVAMTLGFAADIATGVDKMRQPDSEKAGDELLAMLMQQLKDKSFLSGISDVSNALDVNNGNLGERLGNYAARQASSFAIPALVSQTARTIDPVQRDTRDLPGAFVGRIPFASQSLTPRTDVWGRDVPNPGGVGPDLLSPMRLSTARNDPLSAAMLKVGATLNEPGRTVAGRKLSRVEMNDYKRATGALVRSELAPIVLSPEWSTIDPAQRKGIIDKAIVGARKTVRTGMFGSGKPAASSAGGVPPPPPGFVMDAASIPPPPPGFVLNR